AFALVGLGRPDAADLGRGLAQHLAVDPAEDDQVLVDLRRDALGQLEHHRVREPERHVQLLPGDVGAIADAVDLQTPLETFRDALDHVGDQRAQHAVLGAVLTRIVGALHVHHRALDLHRDAGRHRALELALGSLDLDVDARDGDVDALRDRNDFATYAAHGYQ